MVGQTMEGQTMVGQTQTMEGQAMWSAYKHKLNVHGSFDLPTDNMIQNCRFWSEYSP